MQGAACSAMLCRGSRAAAGEAGEHAAAQRKHAGFMQHGLMDGYVWPCTAGAYIHIQLLGLTQGARPGPGRAGCRGGGRMPCHAWLARQACLHGAHVVHVPGVRERAAGRLCPSAAQAATRTANCSQRTMMVMMMMAACKERFAFACIQSMHAWGCQSCRTRVRMCTASAVLLAGSKDERRVRVLPAKRRPLLMGQRHSCVMNL